MCNNACKQAVGSDDLKNTESWIRTKKLRVNIISELISELCWIRIKSEPLPPVTIKKKIPFFLGPRQGTPLTGQDPNL